jgi:hypothetical protein
MRCHCCDKALTEAEIQFIPQTLKFEMCSICLEVAMDAAYSDGFVRPDEMDEIPILDPAGEQLVLYGDDFGPDLSAYSPHSE